jgi:hypothetical protein
MPQVKSGADRAGANDRRHQSKEELGLLRMAVTDEELQAIGVTDSDLVALAPTLEEVLAMTDAHWAGLRLSQNALTLLREDLMRRLGVSVQNLSWLSRAIKREQHGHTRSLTGTD